MKRVLVILAAAMVLFAGNGFSNNAWGPVVAYWDTADESDGIGFGAFFSFGISENVAFDLRYTWFSDLAADSDLSLEVMPFEAGISFIKKVGSSTALHLGGGLGYYVIDGSVDNRILWDSDFDTDDEMGLYASVGIETTVADNFSEGMLAEGITLFLDAGYRHVNVSGSDSDSLLKPTLDDGALDGLMANAGIRFMW